MQTLQQIYAADVYDKVSSVKDDKRIDHKKYGSMAHKLPVLVRQSGLVQALAFVLTRGEDAHKRLVNDLAQTLDLDDDEALFTTARQADLKDYMWLTRRALVALSWYKRFAESVLGVKVTDKGEGQ